MIYAQFFQLSTGYVAGSVPPRFDGPRVPVEACGDRAVIILDGRRTVADNVALARSECAARGFVGFQLCRGRTFTDSRPVTAFQPVGGADA